MSGDARVAIVLASTTLAATATSLATPLTPAVALAVTATPVILLAVPLQSIREWGRRLADRSGVGWQWWALVALTYMLAGQVAATLGAPDALAWCGEPWRSALCPTGYGVGTALLGIGAGATLLCAGVAWQYTVLYRHDPAAQPCGVRATVEGAIETRQQPLTTPVDDAEAVWYALAVDERDPDRLLGGSWLPVGSAQRSRECFVTDPEGHRLSLHLDDVALLPTTSRANVRTAATVVRPDEPEPAGVARLDEIPRRRTDSAVTRRYREHYVEPMDVGVAHGRFDDESGSRTIGAEGTVLLGANTSYGGLRTALGVWTAFLAVQCLLTLGVGAALVLQAL